MKDENWITCSVADIAAPIRNALVGGPFGSNLVSNDYVSIGIPVIRGQNMVHGRWVTGEFVYISYSKAYELASNTARPGDLVFTQRGTLGQVAIVPQHPFDHYVVSQSQMKLTVDPNKANVFFLYYFFSSKEQQEYIRRNAIQTGVPHTNLEHLRTTPLWLPPLPEQQAIAHILSTLDDKIELNRRMNETLEAIASAIFKSWFVDFDPVHAKMEGRQPYGIDAETAALFPDSFEESRLGKIPKGWKVGTLGDVIIIHDSKRVPLSSLERAKHRGPYPYYGAASILDYVDSYLFDGIYILMGEDGSVIDEEDHPVIQYVWGRFWANNHAHVLQGNTGITAEHILLFLQQVNIRPYVTGAVQPKLNQTNMIQIPFLLPPKEICAKFGQILSIIFANYRANSEQSQTLILIRDTLLPKLLSGEIRVKDAEKFVEANA